MFTKIALLSALVAAVQALTVSTPASLIECQPVALTWGATTSPYYINIFPGGQTTGALASLGDTTDTTYTWTVNVASGTSVTIAITDGTGATAYTDALTVQAGSSSSCLSSSSASAASSSSATSAAAASGSASAAAASGSASAAASGTSASASAASASSSSTSGAGKVGVAAGAVVGAAALALVF